MGALSETHHMAHICAYKRHMSLLLMMRHLQPLRGYAAERRDMHQEYSSVALVVTLPVVTQCSGPCSATGVANASSSPKPCLYPFNSFLSSPVDSVVCGHVLFLNMASVEFHQYPRVVPKICIHSQKSRFSFHQFEFF